MRINILIAFISIISFLSCNDDIVIKPAPTAGQVAYIINYGTYSGANGEISIFDIDKGEITDSTGYLSANGLEFNSKIESVTIVDSTMYLMSNNGDKIDILDANTLKQTINPIYDGIVKPRFMLEHNGTGYISCWGNVEDWNKVATSYIAKMNLDNFNIEKFPVPGGPEGMSIVKNTLYIAQTARNTIVTMNLLTEAIDSFKVPAIPQQFALGSNRKLYVSLVSKYLATFPTEKLGIAIINLDHNNIENFISVPTIGSNGFIELSPDKNTLYVLAREEYPGKLSSIISIDLTDNSKKEIITGESFNGLGINPENSDIYVLISPSATERGLLKIYDKDGKFKSVHKTMISPKHVVFYTAT